MRRLGKSLFALFLGLTLVGCSSSYLAAEDLSSPVRVDKVKVGDWILYKNGDRLIKETAIRVDKTKEDVIVLCRQDLLNEAGVAIESGEVTFTLSKALENKKKADELYIDDKYRHVRLETGMKREKREVEIGGKKITIVALIIEKPIYQETWLSDEISINGRVAFKSISPDKKLNIAIEPVDFGNEKEAGK